MAVAQGAGPATRRAYRDTACGTVAYPALDNVDFREGTLECWVRLGFEADDYLPSDGYEGFAILVTMDGEVGAGMQLYYQAQPKQPAIWYCSLGPEKYFFSSFVISPPVHKGEWHHLAVTWRANTFVIYFDGKKCAEVTGHGT